MLKPCSYCHYKPRRPGSAYCCDEHAEKKHSQNHRDPEKRRVQMRVAHARRRAQMKIEQEEEMKRQREILEAARNLLNESDNTLHRLQPEQRVKIWNVITGEIKEMKL